MRVFGQRHARVALPPTGNTRYPLCNRLGGPQGQSVRVQKISPSPGFDSRPVLPVASRYTDYPVPATGHQTQDAIIYVLCKISGVWQQSRIAEVPDNWRLYRQGCSCIILSYSERVGGNARANIWLCLQFNTAYCVWHSTSRMGVFSDGRQCRRLVNSCRRFGRTRCLHLQGVAVRE